MLTAAAEIEGGRQVMKLLFSEDSANIPDSRAEYGSPHVHDCMKVKERQLGEADLKDRAQPCCGQIERSCLVSAQVVLWRNSNAFPVLSDPEVFISPVPSFSFNKYSPDVRGPC